MTSQHQFVPPRHRRAIGLSTRAFHLASGATLIACSALAACSQAPIGKSALGDSRLQAGSPAPVPSVPVYGSARLAPSSASYQPPKSTASRGAPSYSRFSMSNRPPKVRGVYKIGKPYQIAGKTYYPADEPSYDRTGIASWYGDDFHGKKTANGEIFDMHALTAAHPTLPLPSYLRVTNLKNGRTILVRLNDRGPYKPGRIIDLSRASARELGFHNHGVTEIRVQYAGRAPLDFDDTRERRFLSAQSWNRRPGAPFGLGLGRLIGSR